MIALRNNGKSSKRVVRNDASSSYHLLPYCIRRLDLPVGGAVRRALVVLVATTERPRWRIRSPEISQSRCFILRDHETVTFRIFGGPEKSFWSFCVLFDPFHCLVGFVQEIDAYCIIAHLQSTIIVTNMSRRIRRTAATILRLFVAASSFPSLPAIPTPLPFPFGIATNDTFPDVRLALPQPMAFLNRNSSFVLQRTDGYIRLEDQGLSFVGFVDIYDMDIDTSRGAQDQNQVWLRVGSNLTDLPLARDIIAGNGTFFHPSTSNSC